MLSFIKKGLTNNQLKIIAMVSMLIDHIGEMLFPNVVVLNILGRFAFPIFAYMIAEGARYTKNRMRYLAIIAVMGIIFQVVFFVFKNSLYMGILITFSLSIGLIYCIDALIEKRGALVKIISSLIILAILFFSAGLPLIFKDKDFSVDYTVIGVLLPVAVYYSKNKLLKLISTAIFLFAIALTAIDRINGYVQFFMLLAIPLLFLYNGKRGKINLKYLFYIFYPLHFIVLYGISMIL